MEMLGTRKTATEWLEESSTYSASYSQTVREAWPLPAELASPFKLTLNSHPPANEQEISLEVLPEIETALDRV